MYVCTYVCVADCSASLTTDTFETGTLGYSQDTSDDFNWSRDNGGTPSGTTGPSVDHTLGTAAGEISAHSCGSGRACANEQHFISLYCIEMLHCLFALLCSSRLWLDKQR